MSTLTTPERLRLIIAKTGSIILRNFLELQRFFGLNEVSGQGHGSAGTGSAGVPAGEKHRMTPPAHFPHSNCTLLALCAAAALRRRKAPDDAPCSFPA